MQYNRRAWARLLDVPPSTPRRPSAAPRAAQPNAGRRKAPRTLPSPARAFPAVQIVDVRVAPKPRMSRRDQWLKRPCVLRYRASCDELRLKGLVMPERYLLVFFIPMPASWSRTQRDAMRGRGHQSKPDGANLLKSVEDALHPRDERLHDGRFIKVWADAPRLVIIDRSRDRRAMTRARLRELAPSPTSGEQQ